MTYEMKDLIPIISMLAKHYTSFESSSVCEEKAKQFMAAVIYTISVAEKEETNKLNSKETSQVLAKKAYLRGGELLNDKFAKLQNAYFALKDRYSHYGNQCLKDLVEKGFPAFFLSYDITYEPQNTILTLDYPILSYEPGISGILAIEQVLNALSIEQDFLKFFAEDFVTQKLYDYHTAYESLFLNLPEIIYESLLISILKELAETQNVNIRKQENHAKLLEQANQILWNHLRKQNMEKNIMDEEKFRIIQKYIQLSYDDISVRNFYCNHAEK